MKELEIVCLCQGIRLADLGLNLVQGQIVHVPHGTSTADLRRARGHGAISVRQVERVQVVRQGDVPVQPPSIAAAPVPVAVVPSQIPVVAATPPLPDLSGLARTVAGEMLPIVREVVREAVSGLRQDLLQGRTVGTPILAGNMPMPGSEPAPIYIPARIISEGPPQQALPVQATSTDQSAVGDAAQTLKNMRKGKASGQGKHQG